MNRYYVYLPKLISPHLKNRVFDIITGVSLAVNTIGGWEKFEIENWHPFISIRSNSDNLVALLSAELSHFGVDVKSEN